MRKRLLPTLLVLLLVSGSAAAHVKAKKRSHKAKAVASRQVAQDTVRTPPEAVPEPIAPLPVLLIVLAGVMATAFVSFAKALSAKQEAGDKSRIEAPARARSRPVKLAGAAKAGVAVARSFQVDAHQFGKARLVSFP